MVKDLYRYYISSGANNAQYTLRKNYDEVVWYNSIGGPKSGVRNRDYHVINLGIDPNEAKKKAEKFVKKIKEKYPSDKIVLDTNINKQLSKYTKWGDKLKFGKYRGRSIKDVIQQDPDYLIWAYENANLSTAQKEFIKTELKDEIEKKEKVKKEKQDSAKKDALRALHQDQMAKEAITKVNVGQILKTSGKIVKMKWSEGRFMSLQFTIVCREGFLAWFQTNKSEFAGSENIEMSDERGKWTVQRPSLERGDLIEFQMLVTGKGDKIVFGKKPKLLKKKKNENV